MAELSFLLVVFPMLAACSCFLMRHNTIYSLIVIISGGLLIGSAILLIPLVPFSFSPKSFLGINIHEILTAADFLLLFIILYFGVKYKNWLINSLAIFQIVLLGYLEFFLINGSETYPIIYCDNLSLIMVLIICVVGSIICVQALPYMKKHETHLKIGVSRQPHFFFVMILFLGAMNGVVLSNDMILFYFFFELTTVCSFLLIGHDKTERATKNAVRALWMNSLGGAAFITALVFIYTRLGTLDMQYIIHADSKSQLVILSMALLCFAAFTKSAQFPFQSWLLGAMIAPTPVSALLHSSTMVKVGVYLALRLAPAIEGLFLTQCVTIFGAFTFLFAAALAVGQSNGKKVLAYSTISNLGLIFACVGLNTPESIAAAIILIIFHAVSKALLFLCVGTIEQHIESRNIEDMRGLYTKMPLTALISVMGVITMIMPPFGLLLGKWMAMEAASSFLCGIVMIAMGSALTVMYWARWAGILMSDPFAGKFKLEKQPVLTWAALFSLCIGVGVLSLLSPWIYRWCIIPIMGSDYLASYSTDYGIFENAFGVFAVLPLSLVAVAGFIIAILAVKSATHSRITMPYLSGLQTEEPRVFKGPMNRLITAEAGNYYLSSIFGEDKLTPWINLGAVILLTLVIGGAL
ncbi:MAG: NADH-quinone oxidoreductase subunit L [Desulfobacteraceae bacterium]|nr:NADH-quinone oxidoreductase subunit L [Desulfobacteraceae bacterium]MBC2756099.1 NADH-quinone oxidoreductase subunit L [Desulfobacteraceae bacterium]MBC2763744.1 NADH-quinone oxidoreductase subunit L [ANME-2 cluster archaeon]